ncbi:cortexin-1 isoform 1-T1 [Pluvialis apricaria]
MLGVSKVPWTPGPAAPALTRSLAWPWMVCNTQHWDEGPGERAVPSIQEAVFKPKKAGPWRPFLSDVAVWTQPSPPSAARAMLVTPCSCSEELSAWAGANPQLGVAALVAME